MIRILAVLIWVSVSYGQLNGRITSSTRAKGLAGVNVMVKGTYYGSATNALSLIHISEPRDRG